MGPCGSTAMNTHGGFTPAVSAPPKCDITCKGNTALSHSAGVVRGDRHCPLLHLTCALIHTLIEGILRNPFHHPDGVFNDEPSNSVWTNSTGMTGTVLIEIVGLKNAECCPFPCDENRTCGLLACYPTGKLNEAFDELKKVLTNEYGDRVELKLTFIDNGAPGYIQKIIEKDFPPLPIILVNGRVTRIGRISLDRIQKEIEKEC